MLRKFLSLLSVINALTLLASALSTWISPASVWQLSFLAFAFPVLLLINFFFLLLWIALRSRMAFLSLFVMIITWSHTRSTFVMHLSNPQSDKGLKIMTWNVKNFDLYNWSHRRETRMKMMELIRKENPDILCLQEFYSDNDKIQNNLRYISDTLGYPYVHFLVSREITKLPNNNKRKKLWNNEPLIMRWGVATFSRFPISDTGRVEHAGEQINNCARSLIAIDSSHSVMVYNAHLESIHLGYDDYRTLDEISETQSTDWPSLKSILAKMKQAWRKRAQQADLIATAVNADEGRKIIAGDFNDIPVSYTYRTILGDQQDAFVEKGSGFGTTFANRLSVFRIDYLMPDPQFQVNSYRCLEEKLSDHYPVVITCSF